jgi:hypothetical protein
MYIHQPVAPKAIAIYNKCGRQILEIDCREYEPQQLLTTELHDVPTGLQGTNYRRKV